MLLAVAFIRPSYITLLSHRLVNLFTRIELFALRSNSHWGHLSSASRHLPRVESRWSRMYVRVCVCVDTFMSHLRIHFPFYCCIFFLNSAHFLPSHFVYLVPILNQIQIMEQRVCIYVCVCAPQPHE